MIKKLIKISFNSILHFYPIFKRSTIQSSKQKIFDLDQIYNFYVDGENISGNYKVSELIGYLQQILTDHKSKIDEAKLKQLSVLIEDKIEELSSSQYIKLLELMTLMKKRKFLLKFTFKIASICLDKINLYISENKQFMTYSELLNIYYNLRQNRKNPSQELTSAIHLELQKEMQKNGHKNITVYDVINFFEPLINRYSLTQKQYKIQYLFFQILREEIFHKSLPIQQKVILFNVIARYRLEYRSPESRIFQFMYSIKTEIEYSIHQLTFNSIIKLIVAVKFLPGIFQTLDFKLKILILSNIQGKNTSLNFFELLKCMAKIAEWKRIRFAPWMQQKIIENILKKIDYENNQKPYILNLIFLLIHMKFFQNEYNINFLKELNRIILKSKTTIKQIEVSANYGLDVTNLILSFYKFQSSQLNNEEVINLYMIITHMKQPNPQIQSIKKSLEPNYQKLLEKNWFLLSNSILNNTYKIDAWKLIISKLLQKQYNQLNQIQKYQLIVIIILSSLTKQLQSTWEQYLNKNINIMGEQIFIAIQKYLELDNQYQLEMIFRLVEQKMKESRSKFYLNQNFIQNVIKYETTSKKFFKYCELEILKSINFNNIYKIVRILQELDFDNVDYREFLKKISILAQTKYFFQTSYIIDIFHQKDLFTQQNYLRWKNLLNRPHLHIYYICLIQSGIQPNKLPDYQFKNINLKNIRLFLSYNPTLYEQTIPMISNLIDKQLKKHEWLHVLFSFKSIFNHHPQYQKMIMILLNKFEYYAQIMNFRQLFKIGRKVNQLNIKDHKFWKRFFKQIDAYLDKFNNGQIISLLQIASDTNFYDPLDNVKLYKRILSSINQCDKKQANIIINSLSKINYRILPEDINIIKKLPIEVTQINEVNDLIKLFALNDNLQELNSYLGEIISKIDLSLLNKCQLHIKYLIKKYPFSKWDTNVVSQSSQISNEFTKASQNIAQIKNQISKISKTLPKVPQSNMKFNLITFDFKLRNQYIKFIDNGEYFNSAGSHLLEKGELLRKLFEQKYSINIIFIHSKTYLSDRKFELNINKKFINEIK